MSLPEFTIAIWMMPHRDHGYIAEIDADLIDDGLRGGIFQSFADIENRPTPPLLLPEFPHREFDVSEDQMRAIIQMADRASYSFAEHAFTPMLGGGIYGLRLSRGYQEITLVWTGRFEDQDESIRQLYSAVRVLAEMSR